MPKYSVIIGTYGEHLLDCLKPCVESILKYTTLNDFSTELIIVANGCTDATGEYVRDLQSKFHNISLLWFKDGLGFSGAYNEGLKVARGEYIVLFNNDNILLDQPYNKWLEEMVYPFEHSKDTGVTKVGVTGPMKEHCPHADRDFVLFFCAMISREAFEAVGLIDIAFGAGYGEDCDYSAKLENLGFRVVQVPDESRQFYDTNRRTGVFPLYHAGNKTFANWPGGEKLLADNNKILEERYGKKKSIDLLEAFKESHNITIDEFKEAITDAFWGKEMIKKAQLCDGYMSDEELLWLAKQATSSNIVIEVGSWHGRSSRALADNLQDGGKLYCVDTWKGSIVEQDTNHASAKLNEGDHAFMEFCDNLADHIAAGRVVPIRMSSKNAATWFKKQGIKAKLIFIDAGHTYVEVKEDIELWWDKTEEGGILSGHDYNYTDGMWAGVTKAVDDSIPYVSQIDGGNIWYCKILYDKPEAKVVIKENAQPQIYDCFPFFNELDILDIRFAELYDKVDRFVITEATLTHGGKPKPLYFADNLQRYAKYLHKVTHIIVDQYPALDSWSIERHQRDQLMRGLTACKDNDIILISDADEIPRATSIGGYLGGIMGFEQHLYYYKLNCESTQKWDWGKICHYSDVRDRMPCGIRYTPTTDHYNLIKNGGVHYSYLGDTDRIIEKIESTAHVEYNTEENKNRDRIETLVELGEDIFGRPLKYKYVNMNESWHPKYVMDNIDRYKEMGYIKEVEVYECV
jgi:beta-1,4-mannosyl-glycoprotein beta-1,4-N-acetylglucosaminyltransferase